MPAPRIEGVEVAVVTTQLVGYGAVTLDELVMHMNNMTLQKTRKKRIERFVFNKIPFCKVCKFVRLI